MGLEKNKLVDIPGEVIVNASTGCFLVGVLHQGSIEGASAHRRVGHLDFTGQGNPSGSAAVEQDVMPLLAADAMLLDTGGAVRQVRATLQDGVDPPGYIGYKRAFIYRHFRLRPLRWQREYCGQELPLHLLAVILAHLGWPITPQILRRPDESGLLRMTVAVTRP